MNSQLQKSLFRQVSKSLNQRCMYLTPIRPFSSDPLGGKEMAEEKVYFTKNDCNCISIDVIMLNSKL
jgi:hypothetical protein